MRCLALLLIFTTGMVILSTKRAHAQNGQLIEGLFRTWVNSQTEKDRRKRLEAEARILEAGRQRTMLPPTGRDPYEVQLPSGFGAGNRGIVAGVGVPTRPNEINVRSRVVADYAQRLVSFSGEYDRLLAELKRSSSSNAQVRALLPQALEVSATCDSLLRELNGLDALNRIIPTHQSLDRRYRHVSFRVRSIHGIDERLSGLVRRCDQSCSAMCGQLDMQPQFDRVALRDLMITASTYMQALIDDLELASLERGRCRTLQHDCRILRQQLVAASREISAMPYDECVSRFSDFIIRWNRYSERVYQLNDPFLSRRLDRISECGDETYALLWMPPPIGVSEVSGIANRLSGQLESLSRSMTFFALSKLDANQQATLLASMRDLSRSVDDLQRLSNGRASRRELLGTVESFDRRWCEVRPILNELPSIRPGLLAETERGCQQLRDVFELSADYAATGRTGRLVDTAAALEGTSETLRQTLNSYERYMRPNEYRRAVSDASNSFYRHSRELHELLSRSHRMGDRGHLAKVREEAEHLLNDWNQLSADLEELERHGVSGSRAMNVRRLQQQLVPMVGEVAAVLVSF
ncbi:MAG: hypothetical protein AAF802_20335 [Planctomycetota bacterium]